MVKNKLEKEFSKYLKEREDVLWSMKLQSNMLAHTVCPADFIFIKKEGDRLHTCLAEAKMITKKKIFPLRRLTQLYSLTKFDSLHDNCHSFVILGFYGVPKLLNKTIYIIPIKNFNDYMYNSTKKSINMEELETNFYKFLCNSLSK